MQLGSSAPMHWTQSKSPQKITLQRFRTCLVAHFESSFLDLNPQIRESHSRLFCLASEIICQTNFWYSELLKYCFLEQFFKTFKYKFTKQKKNWPNTPLWLCFCMKKCVPLFQKGRPVYGVVFPQVLSSCIPKIRLFG